LLAFISLFGDVQLRVLGALAEFSSFARLGLCVGIVCLANVLNVRGLSLNEICALAKNKTFACPVVMGVVCLVMLLV